jgi:hypothetical protein
MEGLVIAAKIVWNFMQDPAFDLALFIGASLIIRDSFDDRHMQQPTIIREIYYIERQSETPKQIEENFHTQKSEEN